MAVSNEVRSSQSPIRTGEVELLEFLSQRRAWEDWEREITCTDAKAFARGIRNGLLTAMPLWLALAWWLAK